MVPEGWLADRVGSVLSQMAAGVSVNSTDVPASGGQIGILKTSCVSSGRFDATKNKAVIEHEEIIRVRQPVQAGTTIVSRMNTPELVGANGYVDADYPDLFLPDRLWALKPAKEVDSRWLGYWFASAHTRYALSALGTGTSGSMKNITKEDVRSLPIALPPLPEQKKIADILSTWDKAIQTTEKLLANAEKQKRALMQQLLTGKRRLKGFEGEWKEIAVGSIGQVVGGGTPDSENADYWDGGILWATPTDITRLTSRFIGRTGRTLSANGLKNCAAKTLPPGSLLVCTRATVGELAIASTEITTNQGFKSLLPKREYDVEFLYYLLSFNKHKLIRLACGSTFLELSKRDFERCIFLVPGNDEQQAIASVLNSASDCIERTRNQISVLMAEKRALMQQLLTGKRRVAV